MFNYSEWLEHYRRELSNLYHPEEHGLGDTAARVGYSFAFDVGYDVLREFWPEITRKLKAAVFRMTPYRCTMRVQYDQFPAGLPWAKSSFQKK